MNFQLRLLALLASFQLLRLRLAGGQALLDGADLLGLQFQPAARPLGFQIQLGHAAASRGQRGFRAIAGFLRGGVLALLLLHLRREILESRLRLIQIQRQLGGFAFQHLEAARRRRWRRCATISVRSSS